MNCFWIFFFSNEKVLFLSSMGPAVGLSAELGVGRKRKLISKKLYHSGPPLSAPFALVPFSLSLTHDN